MEKIINFIFPKYKKLKEENEKLRKENSEYYNDIYNLTQEVEPNDKFTTEIKWNVHFATEKSIIYGIESDLKLTGILNLIDNETNQ